MLRPILVQKPQNAVWTLFVYVAYLKARIVCWAFFFQPLKRLATVVWHLRRRWLSRMLYGMVVRQQMPRRGMTKVASQFIGWLLGSHENACL
jgi:hypothetical protein